MAEQTQPVSSGFVRLFLPGLVLGVVVGALAGAFVATMLSEAPPSRGEVKLNPSSPPRPRDERPPAQPKPADTSPTDAKPAEPKPAEPSPK